MSKNITIKGRFVSGTLCFRRLLSFLSPPQISRILQQNEYTFEPKHFGPVKRVFVNQLPANSPCEDRSLTSVVHWSGLKPRRPKHAAIGSDTYLFSVIDGHAGGKCADHIASRLHQFLSMAFRKWDDDNEADGERFDSHEPFEFHRLLPYANKVAIDLPEQRRHVSSWRTWLDCRTVEDEEALLRACFERLDANLIEDANSAAAALLDEVGPSVASSGAGPHSHHLGEEQLFDDRHDGPEASSHTDGWRLDNLRSLINAASSGACCCTVMITRDRLTVANTGDCFAVLGRVRPAGRMSRGRSLAESFSLTVPHNYWNPVERARIINEHPNEEYAISSERLLACLLPFRAFGDANFKLPLSTLNRRFARILGSSFILPNYISPPYLTASPETSSYTLMPDSDQFIIVASDGLSDMISGQAAVTTVQQFLNVERALRPCTLTDQRGKALSFKALNKELGSRADALSRQQLLAAGGRTVVGVDDWLEENCTRPLPRTHHQSILASGGGTGANHQNNHHYPLADLVDQNAATHLIRHALSGGNPNTVDYSLLEYLLSHSNPRMVRDDITVIIIQLNPGYLAMCAADCDREEPSERR